MNEHIVSSPILLPLIILSIPYPYEPHRAAPYLMDMPPLAEKRKKRASQPYVLTSTLIDIMNMMKATPYALTVT